jgi:hypothetical protein
MLNESDLENLSTRIVYSYNMIYWKRIRVKVIN